MGDKVKFLVVRAVPPERRDKEGKVRRTEGEGWWPEIGRASKNKDGSLTLYLDALPTSGKAIVVVKEVEKKDAPASAAAAGDDIPF